MIRAYAARAAGGKLEPFEYDPGPLGPSEVDIRVEFCGICHSDLSMLDNEWGNSRYPFVPGHEVVGRIAAVGARVKDLAVGGRVGLGWLSASCMQCEWCQSGDLNLCQTRQPTIAGRYGGFADHVRAQAAWVIALPDRLDARSAGPLFCGGITVFNPLVQYNVHPTDRVGVIGIGGLGHMALRFLDAWGCEVTAFSSTPGKEEEALRLGADHFVNSRDSDAIRRLGRRFDFILATVNVNLDWNAYLDTLRPTGRLHLVGVPTEPVTVPVRSLLFGQQSLSASPVGSPRTIRQMLDFAARHHIAPTVEFFAFDQVNEAMARLRRGEARYRIVLENPSFPATPSTTAKKGT